MGNDSKLRNSLLSALAILASGLAVAEEQEADQRPDLYFREVLFHFYPGEHYDALSHLVTARSDGRLTVEADEAELLLGGLFLEYGLPDQAEPVFAEMLTQARDPSVHGRAWLYTGKLRYRAGDYSGARAALNRADQGLTGSLADERDMLMAQSLMAEERYNEAAEFLAVWEGESEWQTYARYNLGVALVRAGRQDQGMFMLDELGRVGVPPGEELQLRDQANLALGYSLLQSGQPQLARTALSRVTLESAFTPRALLGAGWADAARSDFSSALGPWSELETMNPSDSAVQESLLAVPYAFRQLGDLSAASRGYQRATSAYSRELTHLDELRNEVRSGVLVPALLADDEAGGAPWAWDLEALPHEESSGYLYELIASHAFQAGLRTWRDLDQLRQRLAQWQERMATYGDMLDTRRAAYAAKSPTVNVEEQAARLEMLREERDEMAGRMADARENENALALATPAEAESWAMLAALENNPALTSSADPVLAAKYRVLRGSLQWDLEKAYKRRLWRGSRQMEALDQQIAEAETRLEALSGAMVGAPERNDELAEKIQAVSGRLDAMLAQVDTVLGHQRRDLEQMALVVLEQRSDRIQRYQAHAQFALATLYDQALADASGGEDSP